MVCSSRWRCAWGSVPGLIFALTTVPLAPVTEPESNGDFQEVLLSKWMAVVGVQDKKCSLFISFYPVVL